MGKERLSPPRPRRGELFYIAERYLESREGTMPEPSAEQGVLYRGNFMFSPVALGVAVGSLIGRLRSDHLAHARLKADQAALAAELACRDLDNFHTVDELARHILQNEHPSQKR